MPRRRLAWPWLAETRTVQHIVLDAVRDLGGADVPIAAVVRYLDLAGVFQVTPARYLVRATIGSLARAGRVSVCAGKVSLR